MTDTPTTDISPEAVERIKAEVMTLEHNGGLWVTAEDYAALSAALLSVCQREAAMIARPDAKLDAAEAARDRWRSMWEKEQSHNEELEAKLNAAVDVIQKIAAGNPTCDSPEADAAHSAALARAFLASLEGDKP